MSAPSGHTSAASFAERIARIEARKATTPKRPVHRERRLGYALSLVGAVAVGMLVVVAARYARYHLTGVTPGSTTLHGSNIAVDMALAFLAGIVLHQIFNFRRPEHVAAKSFGMFVMAFTMHMAVHRFPVLFAMIFSEDWVHQVIRLTDPSHLALF